MASQNGALKVALSAAADTAGAVLAVENTSGEDRIITNLILNVTTGATGACTLDAGVAADGTTLNDTLIDGVDIAEIGCFDMVKNAGTNGAGARTWADGTFITVSTASGAVAGTVGYAYIQYIVV